MGARVEQELEELEKDALSRCLGTNRHGQVAELDISLLNRADVLQLRDLVRHTQGGWSRPLSCHIPRWPPVSCAGGLLRGPESGRAAAETYITALEGPCRRVRLRVVPQTVIAHAVRPRTRYAC